VSRAPGRAGTRSKPTLDRGLDRAGGGEVVRDHFRQRRTEILPILQQGHNPRVVGSAVSLQDRFISHET